MTQAMALKSKRVNPLAKLFRASQPIGQSLDMWV
jgi:hypothetical protein